MQLVHAVEACNYVLAEGLLNLLPKSTQEYVLGFPCVTIYRNVGQICCPICEHQNPNHVRSTIVDLAAMNMTSIYTEQERHRSMLFFSILLAKNPVPFNLCHRAVQLVAKQCPLLLMKMLVCGEFVTMWTVCTVACELNLVDVIEFVVSHYPHFYEQLPYTHNDRMYSGVEYRGTTEQHWDPEKIAFEGPHP